MNSGQDGNAFQQFGANNVGAGNGAGNGIDYGASYNPGAAPAGSGINAGTVSVNPEFNNGAPVGSGAVGSGFNAGMASVGSQYNAGMLPVDSGQGFVSNDSGDIRLTATPRKGSKKGVIAAVIVVFLLAAAAAAGLWFMAGGGVVGGSGGTTTERFNRFANYLIYEEDSSEWGHEGEEFSMGITRNFLDRFYSYSNDERKAYFEALDKKFDNYLVSYSNGESSTLWINENLEKLVSGFLEISKYEQDFGVIDYQVKNIYVAEGLDAANSYIDSLYASLIESDLDFTKEAGSLLKERAELSFRSYVLSRRLSEQEIDGVLCYNYDGYSCLEPEIIDAMRTEVDGGVIMSEDNYDYLIKVSASNLVKDSWNYANSINEEVGSSNE